LDVFAYIFNYFMGHAAFNKSDDADDDADADDDDDDVGLLCDAVG